MISTPHWLSMGAAGNPTFSLRDRAAYLPAADVLVAADLHLGQVQTGLVEFPVPALESIQTRLTDLISQFTPKEIVLAGDILHSFNTIPSGVPAIISTLKEQVNAAGRSLVIVSGNHDTLLGSLHDPVAEYVLDDGTVVCHGDTAPDASADRYVIGHDHPAIEIEGQRRPCYLYGETVYCGADVLVLPAFNQHARGTIVNGMTAGDALSPMLEELHRFQPIIWDAEAETTHTYPQLGNIQEYL